MIHHDAVKCKHCRTFLKGEPGMDPQEAERIQKEVARLTAAANEPARLEGQPRKIRIGTWIVTVLLAGSVGLIVWGASSREDAGVGFGVLLTIVFALWWLIAFINDLATPSIRGRRRPRSGAMAFLKRLQFNRLKEAWHCLAPPGREAASVSIPVVPELDSRGGTTSFRDASGFARYWKALIAPLGGKAKRVTSLRVDPVFEEENLARFKVTVSIEHYPQWIWVTILAGVLVAVIIYMLIRKTHPMQMDVTLVKYRSQWWVLTGQVDSPFDRIDLTAQPGSSETRP
jgi:hypothetical protein